MIKEIQLYEYQKDMLQQIEDAFVMHQSVMVQMPTGTGKTVLISEVVKREERRVNNPCVWIVVHRKELVEQIKETLETMMSCPYNRSLKSFNDCIPFCERRFAAYSYSIYAMLSVRFRYMLCVGNVYGISNAFLVCCISHHRIAKSLDAWSHI